MKPKQHLEFVKVDLKSGWEVPPGYPPYGYPPPPPISYRPQSPFPPPPPAPGPAKGGFGASAPPRTNDPGSTPPSGDAI